MLPFGLREGLRRGIWGGVMGLAVFSTSGCSLGYLLQQGHGQVSLLMRREPLERLLNDPTLDAEQRDRLGVVQEAKAFAEEQLGLKRSASYTQLVRLDRDAVSYVVAGAPKDKLEPHLWWFPVVGHVPYKGYFSRENAEREKADLERRGLDAYLRGVAAFSLLGIVPDPLYSPMLKSSRAGLANVIIHELTHGTAFLAGKPSFNEGFATFVGDKGALRFLEARYGSASSELAEAHALARDQARYGELIVQLVADLRALYDSGKGREAILAERERRFARAQSELAALPFETAGYRKVPERVALNNAYLVTYLTYHGNMSRFEQVYERLGKDLRAFVAFFRDRVAKERDPEAFLDGYLEGLAAGAGDETAGARPGSSRGKR